MTRKSEAEVRAAYPDILLPSDEPSVVRVVQDLDFGLKAIEPPAALWSTIPQPLSIPPRGVDPAGRSGGRLKRWPVLGVVTTVALVAATVALAVSGSITNLGKPTNQVPSNRILGGFRHVGVRLSVKGKPELVFLGSQVDPNSAAETWAVVKALDQFGTMSGVSPITTPVCGTFAFITFHCGTIKVPPGYASPRGYATYDLDQARYRSPYLVFLYKDLLDRHLRIPRTLTKVERSLFNRYVRTSRWPRWKDSVWHAALDPIVGETGHQLPLVAVGNYVATGANVAIQGDLSPIGGGMPLPFATIQRSLQTGRAMSGAPPSLVPDFNAEANVVTALICRGDGLRPKSVCRRKAIVKILRHAR